MEIKDFSKKNRERNVAFTGDAQFPTMAEWACALAGEAGEVCDAVKKLSLFKAGLLRKEATEEGLIKNIGEEIADTVMYCDLLADHFGFNLEEIIVDKFNRKSIEFKMEHRL